MGLDITVHKQLILRSGRIYDTGAVACPAAVWDGTLWWQKEAYFMADYAYLNLEHPDGSRYDWNTYEDDDSPYYGEWVLTPEAVRDVLTKCSKALTYEQNASGCSARLSELLPLGMCGRYHYGNCYNDAFFSDIRLVLRTLPCVLEFLEDTDVRLVMEIY